MLRFEITNYNTFYIKNLCTLQLLLLPYTYIILTSPPSIIVKPMVSSLHLESKNVFLLSILKYDLVLTI